MTRPRQVGFAQLAKYDITSGAFVGVMTSETPDEDREIMDYQGSKPYFADWSSSTFRRSGGKSFGNVREMHGLQAAGKLTRLTFDDGGKRILVHGLIIDPTAKRKAAEGVYVGLSIGGRYVDRFPDPELPGYTRYVADPTEVSLVDSPNNPDAVFELVTPTGTKVMKFAGAAGGRTKRVGGKDLPSSAFAYVGDPDQTETWKYPIHDAAHVRNALARWGQEKGIPAGDKARVYGRLKAAAKQFGVEIAADAEKVIKSLYDVGGLAQALQNLEYLRASLSREAEYEGDESPVPAKLRSVMADLGALLNELVAEETDELLALSAVMEDDDHDEDELEPDGGRLQMAYAKIAALSRSESGHVLAAAAAARERDAEPDAVDTFTIPRAWLGPLADEEAELQVLKQKAEDGNVEARIRLEALARQEVRKALRNPQWASSGQMAGFRKARG